MKNSAPSVHEVFRNASMGIMALLLEDKIIVSRSAKYSWWYVRNWTVTRMRILLSWWRHQLETFSALLAICAGNWPVHGEFPVQMPVTQSCDVLFDLRLNKRLSKQSWGWWFETLSRPLWRHRNEYAQLFWSPYCSSFYNYIISSHDRKHTNWCH